MRKTRTIVAVTLLATALCADRAVTGAPVGRAEATGEVSRGFAERLTTSLRRVVPAVTLELGRREGMAEAAWRGDERASQVKGHGIEGDAFRFRLPPPAV
jgi:hypothetical protein